MADALCGPSNPLQNFRKQTQLDRTLQQDRLTGPRNSAAQGFRSHDPRTGAFDTDLYAFEHSTPSPASFQFQQPLPSQAGFAPPVAAGGWAADFQKLQISSPSTPVSFAPQHQQNTSGWGSEFVMHHQRMGTPTADVKGKQVMQEPSLQGGIYNTSVYSPMPYQPQMFPIESMQHQQSFPQQHGAQDMQFSETDFEAAFQDALQQAEEIDQMQTEPENLHGLERDTTKQLPIGSDAINYVEQSDRTHDQDAKDADELARTAGQLLNMVQHDTSDKMKNSQFLDLMRRIRDREVEVQNNDLQSTSKTGEGTYMENETDFYHEIPQSQSVAGNSQTPSADTSTESAHDPDSFIFPDMNAVYAYDAQIDSMQEHPELYSSHDDEYPNPQSQIQALHPGGPHYPEQKSPEPARAEFQGGNTVMSGGRGISAEDFEGRYEENPVLGRRYSASNQA